MPTYEYRCDKRHQFEVMQRMSDDPVTRCEVCGSPVQKLFHPIAVHFKGSGFYNTDYGTKKRSREDKEHSDSKATESAGKSESSSDSNSNSSSKDGAGSSSSDSGSSSSAGSDSSSGKAGSDSGSGKKSDSKAKASSSASKRS